MNAGLGAGTADSRSHGQSLTGRRLSLVERPRKEGVRAKHLYKGSNPEKNGNFLGIMSKPLHLNHNSAPANGQS